MREVESEVESEVELLDLPAPRDLRPDELLDEVHAAGVGHWDDIARLGGWDLGRRPPMALGVEAAGVVLAVGEGPVSFKPGDRVVAHSAPLRDQGAWSEQLVDGRSPAWGDQARAHVGDRSFDAAINAVPNGAASVLDLVRDGGRLAIHHF